MSSIEKRPIDKLVTDHLGVWPSAVKTKPGVGRGRGKKSNPHGINVLRRLILQLAVEGKLVSQNPKLAYLPGI